MLKNILLSYFLKALNLIIFLFGENKCWNQPLYTSVNHSVEPTRLKLLCNPEDWVKIVILRWNNSYNHPLCETKQAKKYYVTKAEINHFMADQLCKINHKGNNKTTKKVLLLLLFRGLQKHYFPVIIHGDQNTCSKCLSICCVSHRHHLVI